MQIINCNIQTKMRVLTDITLKRKYPPENDVPIILVLLFL